MNMTLFALCASRQARIFFVEYRRTLMLRVPDAGSTGTPRFISISVCMVLRQQRKQA